MSFSPKTIGLGVVLLGLLGVAVYMNMGDGAEHDASMDNNMSKYTCSKCSSEFELPLAQARNDVKSGKGILCPKCGAGETRRSTAVVQGTQKSFGATDTAAEDQGSDTTGTVKKKKRVKIGG